MIKINECILKKIKGNKWLKENIDESQMSKRYKIDRLICLIENKIG